MPREINTQTVPASIHSNSGSTDQVYNSRRGLLKYEIDNTVIKEKAKPGGVPPFFCRVESGAQLGPMLKTLRREDVGAIASLF